jgi:ribosomal protein L36
MSMKHRHGWQSYIRHNKWSTVVFDRCKECRVVKNKKTVMVYERVKDRT